MKGKTGGKKPKQIISNTNNNQKTSKHGREGNLNFFSEEIAKNMIDKIISLSLTKVYSKGLDQEFPFYYLNKFINTSNNMLEICNINHDIDEIAINTNKIKRNMTFSYFQKKNFYQIAKTNSFNKKSGVTKIEQNVNNIQFSITISDQNFWGVIPEPKTNPVDRTCNNKNNMKNNVKTKAKDLKEIKDEVNSSFSTVKSNIKTKKYYGNRKLFSLYPKKLDPQNIKKKYNMIDFPSQNIPEECFKRDDETQEIKELRKIFIEEMNKKKLEKENEKKKKITRDYDLKGDKNKNKEKKGNLKLIKEINPDSLIKEFTSVLTNQREIKSGAPVSILEKEIMKMEFEARKKVEFNLTKFKEKEIKKEIVKKLLSKDVWKEKSSSNTSINNLNNINNNNNLNNNDEIETRSKPSGSNFNIITPSIGVKIQENSLIKSGGLNFFEQYNRFSINDFNRTLQNEMIKKMNDYNGLATGISNLSLIKEKDSKDNKYTSLINTDETNEGFYRKTTSNKFNSTQIKKNRFYKSNSVISLANNSYKNTFSNTLKDILTVRDSENPNLRKKILNSIFNNNEGDILFDRTININSKFLEKGIVSPIPASKININKSIFSNTNKDNNSLDNNFKIIDKFNKQILTGEATSKMFGNKTERNHTGIILPKINTSKKTLMKTRLYKTKNYFYRTRRKKNDNEGITYNSNLL